MRLVDADKARECFGGDGMTGAVMKRMFDELPTVDPVHAAGGCMDKNEEHKYCESGTPIGFFGTTMSVLDCYYDITGDWNRVCNCHVTHWMPLPDPPKEG